MTRTTTSGAAVLAAGVVVFGMTCAAWLYAASKGINPGPLFYIAGPVIGSLFLAPGIGEAARASQQAATQTNGGLEARVKAAVASALADRDAARTRQVQGDVSEAVKTPETGPR